MLLLNEKKLSLLKLSLLDLEESDSGPRPEYEIGIINDAHLARTRAGVKGDDAIASFLQHCRAVILEDATLKSILRDHESAFLNGRVAMVFGVPAVWSDKTVDRMKAIIDKSGILQIGTKLATRTIISEPEAAAMKVLGSLMKSNNFKVLSRSS